MNLVLKNGLMLCLFAVVCTGLVSFTFIVTQPAIKAAELKKKYHVLHQVIPPESHDNALVESCIWVQDDHLLGSTEPHQAYVATLHGIPSGIAIETLAPNGYSGRIDLIVGIQLDGKISGVRILSHQETPGLGDKIEKRKSDWVDAFVATEVKGAKDPNWAVRKDGGHFDQFTGATITPRAVIAAVKRTALYFEANKALLFSQPYGCDGVQNEGS